LTAEYLHQPVLLAEALEQLRCTPGSTIVDCTLGGAGHARAIAEAIAPEGTLVGLDVDDVALSVAQEALAPFGQHIHIEVVRASYARLDEVLTELGTGPVDGFLFDFGISSMQVDEAERGLSYKLEGPLDMRMDRNQKLTAEIVVNEYPEDELRRIIKEFGEERYAGRIAAAIAEHRARKRITSTLELAEIVKEAIPAPARRTGPHPARRTFQALRIEVNQELQNIYAGLTQAIAWLRQGGRIVAISYHSLEDRLVKRVFQDWERACVCPPRLPECRCGGTRIAKVITRKPIVPTAEEVSRNPRARSARMRVAERV
jgi:16S rRNA (cytosine1402-N4)-methyltransferase